jgi:hypothetical protein
MPVLDELERLLREPLRDGEATFDAAAGIGLDRTEIDAIATRIGAPLPDDLRTLLAACSKIDGLELEIDFTGGPSFEMAEIFPHGLPIAGDYTGNFWVIDCTSNDAESAIFYAGHDAPVVLWQGRGLDGFLGELRRWHQPPNASQLRDVKDDRLHQVWRTNPGTLTHAGALASPDDDVRAFAATLDETWTIVDMRAAERGAGFSWGRYGPRTRLRRHGGARLFAYARPEPKPGWFSGLFGR